MTIRGQIDEIRTRCGLSRPQFYTLLDLVHESDLKSETLGTMYLERARQIEQAYKAYLKNVREQLERALQKPTVVIDTIPYMSTEQVSKILGIGEFRLSTLRARDRLLGHKYDPNTGRLDEGRRTIYSRKDIETFLKNPISDKGPYSSLALAFISWFQEREDAAVPA